MNCERERGCEELLALLLFILCPPLFLVAVVGVLIEEWQERRASKLPRLHYTPSERVTFVAHHSRIL
jgi:hypothetical protein